MARGAKYYAWKKKHKNLDSKFEKKLSLGLLKDAILKPKPWVKYQLPKTYKPDFKMDIGKFEVYIDSKGMFEDNDEARKYKFIREAIEDQEYVQGDRIPIFVLLFQTPDLEIWYKDRRKDGTKMTHAEWADKNGIKWFSEEGFAKWMFDVEE